MLSIIHPSLPEASGLGVWLTLHPQPSGWSWHTATNRSNTLNEGKGRGFSHERTWNRAVLQEGLSTVAKRQHSPPPPNLSVARQVRVVLRQSSASVSVPHSQDSYYCPLSPPNKVHSPQRGRRGDQDCPQLSREKRRPGEAVAPQLLVHSGPMHASVTGTFTFLRPWCRTGTLAQLSARQ